MGQGNSLGVGPRRVFQMKEAFFFNDLAEHAVL
jgi:hypothetical protein